MFHPQNTTKLIHLTGRMGGQEGAGKIYTIMFHHGRVGGQNTTKLIYLTGRVGGQEGAGKITLPFSPKNIL